MKRSTFLLIAVVIVLIFYSCSEQPQKQTEETKPNLNLEKVKVENVDGIPHIYNSDKPLMGEVTLELEKVFELDSMSIDKEQPPSLSQFNRSGDKLYILDSPQFKIYIFSTEGKLLKQFQIKGQGPGEVERITQFILELRGNDLWIPSERKIIRYSLDGELIEEYKFQKPFREMVVIDENRILGKLFGIDETETNELKRLKLSCLMFDRNEKVLVNYLEGAGLGGLPVIGQNPSGQQFRVIFMLPSITPDIVYRFDPDRNLIYLAKTKNYEVEIKDIQGKLLRVIHRKYENKLLSDADRKEIVDLQLFRQPDEIKKLIAKNLPSNFCSIFGILGLPRGYMAVYIVTGPREFAIDIFDPEGRYIYRMKFPGEGNSYRSRFYLETGHVGIVDVKDDRDIYTEYKIKNLEEIFGNL